MYSKIWPEAILVIATSLSPSKLVAPPPLLTVVQLNVPLPLVDNTCPVVPPVIETLPTAPNVTVPLNVGSALGAFKSNAV